MLTQTAICPNCSAPVEHQGRLPAGITSVACPKCGNAVPLTPAHDPSVETAVPVSGSSSRADLTGGFTHVTSPSKEFACISPPQHTEELGRLGEYIILGELGRGGMGVVYRAEDPYLQREIALKVMLPQYAANAQAKARFLREARSQAKVESDHVVSIHSVAEHEGIPYLVMPILKGMPLQSALKANPRPPMSEVVRIGREVAEGLAAAHKKGLVHRDIKPANIWLSMTDERTKDASQVDIGVEAGASFVQRPSAFRVKILDFGLARVAENDPAATTPDAAPLTRKGAILGTPLYMSPEQARGVPLDARSDLWSLGVMLYQMSTGELPFRGDNQLAVLTAVMADEPLPPMTVNQNVPPQLSNLVMRLLAKDPSRRPANATAVVAGLRAIEQELPKTLATAPEAPLSIISPLAPDQRAGIAAAESPSDVAGQPGDANSWDSRANVAEQTEDVNDSRRAKSANPRSPVWLMVGVLLAVATIVGIVISQMGKKPVEVVEQEPPKPTPQPKDKPAIPADPDRRAAEYVLSIGGTVSIVVNGEPRDIKAVAELPHGRLTLTRIYLNNNQQVTDAGLILFAGCQNVTYLDLNGSQVSDTGLAHFKDCKNLGALYLAATKVTDLGLAHFKECKNLSGLALNSTQVTDVGLAYFKDCKNLSALTLNSTQVTDAGLAHFKDCKNLTSLNLGGTQVTDTGLAYLKDCKSLVHLTVGGPKITDAGLGHFKDCKSLRSLVLDSARLTDAGLPDPDVCRNLQGLGLYGTQVTDDGMARFKGSTAMRDLDLRNGVGDAGLANFKDCKNLQVLRVGPCVTDGGLAHFRSCNLGGLQMVSTQVSEAGMQYFKEWKNLGWLEADGTPINDVGLVHLHECKKLQRLSLKRTKVTAAGIETLKQALPLCRIEWDGGVVDPKETLAADRKAAEYVLSIGGIVILHDRGGFGDATKDLAKLPSQLFLLRGIGLGYMKSVNDANLAVFKDCRHLTALGLDNTAVSDAGLANFSGCTTLTHLHLSATAVTDAGLANFKECKGLVDLGLYSTKITDVGLAKFKECKSLRFLSLERTRITDAGLANFADCKNLSRLRLDGTQVTDAGLAHLQDCKNLTYLNLTKTKVTAAGIADLAKVLPLCKIEWDSGTIEPKAK